MLLVALHAFGHLRPVPGGAHEDVAKLVTVGANPARLVEGTGVNDANAGTPFEGETKRGSAARAELEVEPAPRFVGDVAVPTALAAHLDIPILEDCFH